MKIDAPVVKDLVRGKRLGIAVTVVLSIILTAAEWGLVFKFTLCWRLCQVVTNHLQPVLDGCRTWGALQGRLLRRFGVC